MCSDSMIPWAISDKELCKYWLHCWSRVNFRISWKPFSSKPSMLGSRWGQRRRPGLTAVRRRTHWIGQGWLPCTSCSKIPVQFFKNLVHFIVSSCLLSHLVISSILKSPRTLSGVTQIKASFIRSVLSSYNSWQLHNRPSKEKFKKHN